MMEESLVFDLFANIFPPIVRRSMPALTTSRPIHDSIYSPSSPTATNEKRAIYQFSQRLFPLHKISYSASPPLPPTWPHSNPVRGLNGPRDRSRLRRGRAYNNYYFTRLTNELCHEQREGKGVWTRERERGEKFRRFLDCHSRFWKKAVVSRSRTIRRRKGVVWWWKWCVNRFTYLGIFGSVDWSREDFSSISLRVGRNKVWYFPVFEEISIFRGLLF